MSKHFQKTGRTLFIAYFGGLLLILLYSIYSVPALKNGRAEWIIGNTLTLFIRGFIPIHAAALLFGYSLFSDVQELSRDAGRKAFFLGIVKSSAVLFLVLALVYTVLLEGVLPVGLRLREGALEKARTANELISHAREALEEERYQEALRFLSYYGRIFPDDQDVKEDWEKAKTGAAASREAASKPKNAESAELPLLGMTFKDFLSRAEERFAREDYIGAEHYATMASRMDSEHPVPKRIIAESRDRISRTELSKQARENIEFFRQKRIGYDLLTRKDYIAAFYHLQALLGRHPDDPDIRRYLEDAYQGTRKVSFFLDEIPAAAILSAGDDVLFLNRSEGENREFVHIRRVIPSYALDMRYHKAELEVTGRDENKENGILRRILRFLRSGSSSAPNAGEPVAYYALDIEGIKISRNGDKIYHFRAPYGKFVDGVLVMRCLDRSNRDKAFLPEYFAGEAPDADPSLLHMGAEPEDLVRLSSGDGEFDRANIWNLLSLAKIFSRLGWETRPVYLAFFDRLLLPFSFLILSFFATAFGLRLRSRYLAGPPGMTYLFLPLLPFLTGLAFEVYRLACATVPAAVLASFGFGAALSAFLIFQGFLLFLALFFTAAQVKG